MTWDFVEKTLGTLLAETSALSHDARSLGEAVIVKRSDHISSVLKKMDKHKVHRVFMLDEARHPVRRYSS